MKGPNATRPPPEADAFRVPALLAVPAALALLVASPLPAQEPGDEVYEEVRLQSPEGSGEPARWIVDAGVGLHTPLADLAPNTRNSPTAPREPAPVLSVGVTVSGNAVYLFSPKFGVGVHGVRSRLDVDRQPLLGGGRDQEPVDRGLGKATFVAFSGELVYRPLGEAQGDALDPYLAAGGGVRHLSFEESGLEDGTDPMGTVAGGVRTRVAGPLFWNLELRGFFAPAEPTDRGGRRQSDVVASVGLGVRL